MIIILTIDLEKKKKAKTKNINAMKFYANSTFLGRITASCINPIFDVSL